MNNFVKATCFIGGANLDILKKCPTEKNGFIAAGIGIVNVVIISLIAMELIMYSVLNQNIFLSLIVSLIYGFVIFIGYWGVLSVIRKTAKYTYFIKFFSIVATILISLVTSNAIEKYILRRNILSISTFQEYSGIIFVILLTIMIYLIPIIIKMLINSSTYEEEKEKIEHNFITQKEADIIAYRDKYQDYALIFNDANIKMESLKHLGEISREYHVLLENIQGETFDFINKIDKMNQTENVLLNECKSSVEEQFRVTLEKMSKIFSSI
jgi:hypothetical protein